MISVESRILSTLQHSNVINFFEALYSEECEKLFIVLEFCSKGSLSGLGRAEKGESWDERLKGIVKQSVEGLAFRRSVNT